MSKLPFSSVLPPSHPRQRGAALVVGLVLLLVLTLLAISGMNTATLELQMAGNSQFSQDAFQTAETGIEAALQLGSYDTGNTTPPLTATLATPADTYNVTINFTNENGETPVPPSAGGFSLGVGTGFSAYHFDATSIGTANRDARSTQVQGFYIVGQASN